MYRFAVAALFLVLFAAHAHPAPPESLDLDAFGYSSPQVRESLERFLDTARQTAGDGWTHRILATSTDRRNFLAKWCKTINRKGECLIYRESNVESVHGIDIHATKTPVVMLLLLLKK